MQRVALVTGGARGIGRAIADDLARDHAVALTWRNTCPDSSDALAIRADLTVPDDPAKVIASVLDRFGRLDVIVNNAGQIGASAVDACDMPALQDMLAVNLIGPQALLAAALPHLQPGAAVVNISSINAVFPPRGASIYGASKAALNLWTRAMAKELGPRGIRVNAVAPGAIATAEAPRPQDLISAFVKDTALGRIGLPQDVARAVRFLAGEDAAFITGEILTVSGGYRI